MHRNQLLPFQKRMQRMDDSACYEKGLLLFTGIFHLDSMAVATSHLTLIAQCGKFNHMVALNLVLYALGVFPRFVTPYGVCSMQ